MGHGPMPAEIAPKTLRAWPQRSSTDLDRLRPDFGPSTELGPSSRLRRNVERIQPNLAPVSGRRNDTYPGVLFERHGMPNRIPPRAMQITPILVRIRAKESAESA